MKKQRDTVNIMTKTKFKWRDRIKILFGAHYCIQVSTPVSFDMKRGISVERSSVNEWCTWDGKSLKKEMLE